MTNAIGSTYDRVCCALAMLPASSPEIAAALGIESRTVAGWLRHLHAMGIVEPMARPGRRAATPYRLREAGHRLVLTKRYTVWCNLGHGQAQGTPSVARDGRRAIWFRRCVRLKHRARPQCHVRGPELLSGTGHSNRTRILAERPPLGSPPRRLAPNLA